MIQKFKRKINNRVNDGSRKENDQAGQVIDVVWAGGRYHTIRYGCGSRDKPALRRPDKTRALIAVLDYAHAAWLL